jgi:ATP-dependent protease ClpP protease subunit
MYSEHTKIPKKKLDQFFKHDLYIDSSQALKYGIAEYIYSGNDYGITKKQKIIK